MKYFIPISLWLLTISCIYFNMWFDIEEMGFLFVNKVTSFRNWGFKLGQRSLFAGMSLLIWYLSYQIKGAKNITAVAFCLSIYWFEECFEFVGWYNTIPKWPHLLILTIIGAYGIASNETRH